MNCPCCNLPLRHDVQPALMPGRAPLYLYTCDTRGCKLQHVTLSGTEHAALSGAQIENYARVNARQAVSHA